MKYHNIEELSKDDFKWRKMALKITKCSIIADEIVNEFYLKYLSAKPKTITAFYVKVSLERIYHLMYKRYEYTQYFEQSHTDKTEEYDVKNDIYNQVIYQSILNELDVIHWFHRMIFKYVMIDGISIRELSRQTQISFNVIRDSVVYTKDYLRDKFLEDYNNLDGSGNEMIDDE